MAKRFMYINNDMVVMLLSLRNKATGKAVNDATVTVTLTDASGVEVSGQSWPTSLAYVAGSKGDYQGIFTDSLAVKPKTEYTATFEADGDGYHGEWEDVYVAITRKLSRS